MASGRELGSAPSSIAVGAAVDGRKSAEYTFEAAAVVVSASNYVLIFQFLSPAHGNGIWKLRCKASG